MCLVRSVSILYTNINIYLYIYIYLAINEACRDLANEPPEGIGILSLYKFKCIY